MANIGDRMIDLAQRLLQRTQEGRLEWRRMSPEDFGLSNSEKWPYPPVIGELEHGSVMIESRDGDGAQPFRMSILDPQGNTVEVLESTGQQGPDHEPALQGWERVLGELYNATRQSSITVDPILDELLGELGD